MNAQAQRLVNVLSAVPRNLAIVVRQVSDQKGGERLRISDWRISESDCGKKQSAIRNLHSAIESVGRTRKTGAAMSQIAPRASDDSPVAMQQLEKSPVGSPAANR